MNVASLSEMSEMHLLIDNGSCFKMDGRMVGSIVKIE